MLLISLSKDKFYHKKLALLLRIILCLSIAQTVRAEADTGNHPNVRARIGLEKIVNLANGEWPPYHSQSLEHFGIASQIITEAFLLEGIQVKYHFLPWKRGMVMAKDGKLDGTAVWRHKRDFEKNFFFSDTIIKSQAVFFHLKSFDFDWDRFTELKSLNIGGTIGYGYNDDYTKAEKSQQYHISRSNSDEVNFKMLLAGYIDVFPITTEVGYFILKKHFSSAERQLITHHPKSLTPENERSLHLLLTKANTENLEVLKRFNRGLAKLKQQDRVNQIIREFMKDSQL
ncbi:substrate-binding periplasmic protein [Hahella ganghwensis]|uniref:substrate-binding periplasmic protein n=1 Tax=Hahella ganghwensis TaxID=286420 RepID=UPI000373A31D|nr:transporter substrate-binding domain-containing protein [Hahella ganghwensis]